MSAAQNNSVAIIRIKRRIDEEPLNAFVLNCKRQKTKNEISTTEQNSKESKTVLKFAGTVNEIADTTKHISKITKEQAKVIFKKPHSLDAVKYRMGVNKQKSQNNRFKIINCTRSLNESDGKEENKNLTIVDVEKEQATTTSSETFVYDLYVSEKNASPIDYSENIEEWMVEEYTSPTFLSDLDSDESNWDDDEDSNDEANWRNDYPEEESDYSDESDEEFNRLVERFDRELCMSMDEEESDECKDNENETDTSISSTNSSHYGYYGSDNNRHEDDYYGSDECDSDLGEYENDGYYSE